MKVSLERRSCNKRREGREKESGELASGTFLFICDERSRSIVKGRMSYFPLQSMYETNQQNAHCSMGLMGCKLLELSVSASDRFGNSRESMRLLSL